MNILNKIRFGLYGSDACPHSDDFRIDCLQALGLFWHVEANLMFGRAAKFATGDLNLTYHYLRGVARAWGLNPPVAAEISTGTSRCVEETAYTACHTPALCKPHKRHRITDLVPYEVRWFETRFVERVYSIGSEKPVMVFLTGSAGTLMSVIEDACAEFQAWW